MQITSSLATSAATTTTPSGTVPQQTLNQNDFLQLLATQLSSQDPTAPTDSSQFVTQLASFSSLQQMSALNTNFTGFCERTGRRFRPRVSRQANHRHRYRR